MRRVLTTVTLLGLLVATSAAFAITEHLKLIKSPLSGIRVASPVCACPTGRATVRVRVRHTDRVTVTIVDPAHHTVATLGSDVLVRAGHHRVFTWDGGTDAGTKAPDGVYHPWVHLSRARRTFRFTNRIVLDTKPPEVMSAHVEAPVLLAGPGRSIAIEYTFSERAHPVVYLGRHQIIVGRDSRPRDKVKWGGTLNGRRLSAGRYVLSLGAQDLAGNATPVGAWKQVEVDIRYVELAPARATVRSGRRFTVHVRTAAKRYSWRLGHEHGSRRGRVLRLRAPKTAGTYRLVVTVNGHSQTAVVRVRPK